MVRPMDGWQPKPLFLQHIPPVQPGSPECNGHGAPKHGTECPAPFGKPWYHCDPSTTRPFGPFTEGPFWTLHKHCTNAGSLIDRFWTPVTITVSISCMTPASSHVDWNAQVTLLFVYGHGVGPTNYSECWPWPRSTNNQRTTHPLEVEYLEAP